jgi:hypothetical protein
LLRSFFSAFLKEGGVSPFSSRESFASPVLGRGGVLGSKKRKRQKKWVFRVEFFKGERMRESEKKKANRGKRGERRICAAPHTRVISRLDANSSPPDLRGKEKMERRRERVFFYLQLSPRNVLLSQSQPSRPLSKKKKNTSFPSRSFSFATMPRFFDAAFAVLAAVALLAVASPAQVSGKAGTRAAWGRVFFCCCGWSYGERLTTAAAAAAVPSFGAP